VASVISPQISRARELLLKGEVVAIPTETVYGLAASIESPEGLKKIFQTKERPFFDPLIVHVASLKQASSLAKSWSPLADYLARSFWPGPFTVVVPKADHVNPLITSGLETVAIRYPDHPIALELIEAAGAPLAAPSANKFGRTSPTSPAHVRAEFPDGHLLILEGGECEIGVESTVAAIDENTVTILRPGAITEEMIRLVLKKWSKPVEVKRSTSVASPGNLKHHYMPKIPLVIVKASEPDGLSAQTRLSLQSALSESGPLSIKKAVELVLDSDPAIAARELYGDMRTLAESGADCIYVRNREGREGIWSAIWDRLDRAATLDISAS
jgi:L-threonylcarbamoyladenylate synthase